MNSFLFLSNAAEFMNKIREAKRERERERELRAKSQIRKPVEREEKEENEEGSEGGMLPSIYFLFIYV